MPKHATEAHVATAIAGKANTTDLDLKAPLASPALTGTPTAPTPTAGDNSTKIATTAFVKANAGAGYVAQAEAPTDTNILWYDTDDGGDSAVGNHADTVDGFHASSTPTPNTIPVLNSSAKLPVGMLGTGAAYSAVQADQATSSTTYTDLATVGPTVTVTIGSNGIALVSIGAGLYNNATGKNVGVAISGATTRSAPDAINTLRKDDAPFTTKSALTYLETGLNPGVTTFTMKYKTSGASGNFFDRTLTVVPL